MSNLIQELAGPMVALMDDWKYWVIGLNKDGSPRDGFTLEECKQRMRDFPSAGTLEGLAKMVDEYKPHCYCGKVADVWYRDIEVIKRQPLNREPLEVMVKWVWVCGEHKRDE